MPDQSPRLLDQVRRVMRLKHMSPRTEESYVDAIKRFLRFYQLRHPRDMGAPEIRAYLSYKDLDFAYGQITVRDGKGEKDRR
jgi:hypothetical protein